MLIEFPLPPPPGIGRSDSKRKEKGDVKKSPEVGGKFRRQAREILEEVCRKLGVV